MTRILSVASECAPLVKTGGLADVAGALPHALEGQGIEMRTLLPGYPKVMGALGQATELARFDRLYGGKARLVAGRAAGLDLMALDAPHLYDRDGSPYLDPQGQDWDDNAVRFAALCRAGALIAAGQGGEWRPDILHGHDWQAGLAPYFIARDGLAVPTIITIHNMAFAGLTSPDRIEALGLARADFHPDVFEYWGHVSLLKAGLVTAHAITTVSPTYARELKTEAFGMGFDGLLRARSGTLHGILNGIDTEAWNPATDAHAATFRSPRGKSRATKALRAELGLPDVDGPLVVVISRLTQQKGLDLLLAELPRLLRSGAQLALLGSGDRVMESEWRSAEQRHDGLSVHVGYNEALSHRMIAGGDAILVPSRFEPCGLTQLYGLRYGTIPVVARTGGLADTVIDANDAALRTGTATGIVHDPGTAEGLGDGLDRLVALWRNGDTWRGMVKAAMRHPVGWEVSAAQYADLYRSLLPPA